MARLRYVDLSGTIGSGNLNNSATTHTFTAPLTYAGGTTVPTLAGTDYFLLSILNTAGTAVSEVVKVTAYNQTTGAATITRAQEGTTGVSHTSADKVLLSDYPSDLAPSWEEVVLDLSGKVHRWKFEETSGATVADSVGSLNLTLSGSAPTNYVRNITGPTGLGKACQFISATADSSGLGSIPVASTDRTFVWVSRTTSVIREILFNYGVNALSTFFMADHNSDGAATTVPGALACAKGGTGDIAYLGGLPFPDGEWHMGAIGMRGGTGKNRFIYMDGATVQVVLTTAANTTASGNFQMSFSGIHYVGDVADLIVFNRGLTKYELDRLYAAFARAL